MKIIKIYYGNGAIYGFPVEAIAHDRATYYAEKDVETTFQEEYDFTMSDWPTAYDWLRNNMSDFKSHIFEIEPPDEFDPVAAMDDENTDFGKFDNYEKK